MLPNRAGRPFGGDDLRGFVAIADFNQEKSPSVSLVSANGPSVTDTALTHAHRGRRANGLGGSAANKTSIAQNFST